MEVVMGTAQNTENQTTETVGGEFRIQRTKTVETVGNTVQNTQFFTKQTLEAIGGAAQSTVDQRDNESFGREAQNIGN